MIYNERFELMSENEAFDLQLLQKFCRACKAALLP